MNSDSPDMTNPQRIRRAMDCLSGQEHAPTLADFAKAADLFSQAKEVPFAKAKLAVMTALGCGVEQNVEAASVSFVDAVMGGFPPLMTDMAVILEAYSSDLGADKGLVATLLRQAARQGDLRARYLLVRAGLRGEAYVGRDDWGGLRDSLPEGTPLLEGRYVNAPPIQPAQIERAKMEAAMASAFAPSAPSTATLCNEHDVRAVPRALTSMQCDYLISLSAPLMQPSKVVADSGSLQAGYRTSDGAVILPALMDMPLVQILFSLSAAAGAAPQQGEFLSLLRYRPGQEYRPHHDYLSQDEADYSQVGRTGQRKLTLLTYLNEGYSGGETDFPDLDVRFKGSIGDTLIFANTDEDGTPLPKSRHAGRAVESGEKWLATLWIREKNFWPWAADNKER